MCRFKWLKNNFKYLYVNTSRNLNERNIFWKRRLTSNKSNIEEEKCFTSEDSRAMIVTDYFKFLRNR